MPESPLLAPWITPELLDAMMRAVDADEQTRSISLDGWSVTAWRHGSGSLAVEMFAPRSDR